LDPSSSTRHWPQLDGWRGMAILLVLAAHFGGLRPLGLLGVQAFFALSGLLMARLLFEQRMPLGTFYRRRIARILPAFLLFLGAMAALNWVHQVPGTPPGSLAWSLVFLRTYLPGSDIWADPLVGHLWSLNVEEHAYVAMSLLALAFAARPRAAALSLGACAMACLAAFALYRAYPQWAAAGASAPYLRTEVAAFAICTSAALRVALGRLQRPIGSAAFVAALCLLLVAVLALEWDWEHGGNLLRYFAVPFLLGLLVNLVVLEPASAAMLNRALAQPVLRWFGLVSYSLYLWHYPIWRFTADVASPCVALSAALTSVALAALSYYVLERPARRWINGPAP
jgi:peptidoglycan/LPS O-acetylase OafA/YrhL